MFSPPSTTTMTISYQTKKKGMNQTKGRRSPKLQSAHIKHRNDWLLPQRHLLSLVWGCPYLQFERQSVQQKQPRFSSRVIELDSSCSQLSEVEVVEIVKPLNVYIEQIQEQTKLPGEALANLTEDEFSKLAITEKEKETSSVVNNSEQEQQNTSLAEEQFQETSQHSRTTINPREQPSSAVRKRIYEQEQILHRLKNHYLAGPFLTAVNEKDDNAPDYYTIIKEPMDLEQASQKNRMGLYPSFIEFHEDIQKIWKNSYLYNKKNPYMKKATNDLKRFYLKLVNRQISLLQT